jgi:hypothetical protein
MDAREAAERNRQRCPLVAAIVDAFRAEFGPGVSVVWAVEGDVELGCRPEAINKS